jgi:hypothetical protein
LGFKKKTYDRRHTKGSFAGTQFNTSSGCWMNDRDWKHRANQMYLSHEKERDEFDLRLIVKKKEQKRIQYMALESQYKLYVRTGPNKKI